VIIDLTELLRRTGEEADIEQEFSASYPEDGLPLTSPIKAKLHLVNTGAGLLLTGEVTTTAEAVCAHCGEAFPLHLKAKIEENFAKKTADEALRKTEELSEADFVFPIEPDNSLDLGEIIRQDLLLALPSRPLCPKENG
jgi:uncharacterized metal-binding protein YceD (DUF177 family)